MIPPVRTVCVACLHSLDLSGVDEAFGRPSCPHCGRSVDPPAMGSDTPTTDEGFSPPPEPDSEAPTVRHGQYAAPLPDRIGRFIIREPLGEGGYGEVFRAYDPHLEREVALKVLKPNRLGEKSLERFFREARAAARLDHPNIVALHDAGRDDDRCWIAYQLVQGRTLSSLRDTERIPLDRSVRIIGELALALDHAHGRGVYHRDLKPANVLIDKSGRARLTDFGLARRSDLDSDLTREGTVLGTPQYMSPEAAAGRAHEADGRSDVYSLGVMLYELICGRRPADVPSGAPLWRSTRMTSPPTPRSVDRMIPAELDRITMRALALDPAARHPNARAFAEALDRYLETRPVAPARRVPAPRRSFAFGTVVAVAVLLVALGIGLTLARHRAVGGPVAPDGATDRPAVVEAALTLPEATPGRVEPAAPVGQVAILNPSSRKFHRAGCSVAKRMTNPREIPFPDAETIRANGWSACGICLPR